MLMDGAHPRSRLGPWVICLFQEFEQYNCAVAAWHMHGVRMLNERMLLGIEHLILQLIFISRLWMSQRL